MDDTRRKATPHRASVSFHAELISSPPGQARPLFLRWHAAQRGQFRKLIGYIRGADAPAAGLTNAGQHSTQLGRASMKPSVDEEVIQTRIAPGRETADRTYRCPGSSHTSARGGTGARGTGRVVRGRASLSRATGSANHDERLGSYPRSLTAGVRITRKTYRAGGRTVSRDQLAAVSGRGGLFPVHEAKSGSSPQGRYNNHRASTSLTARCASSAAWRPSNRSTRRTLIRPRTTAASW